MSASSNPTGVIPSHRTGSIRPSVRSRMTGFAPGCRCPLHLYILLREDRTFLPLSCQKTLCGLCPIILFDTTYFGIERHRDPLSEDDTAAGSYSVLSPAGEVRVMAIGRTQSPGPGRRNLGMYGLGADGIGNAPLHRRCRIAPPATTISWPGSMVPRHMPALVLIRSTLPGQVYPT